MSAAGESGNPIASDIPERRFGFWRRCHAMMVKEFIQLRRDRVSFAMIVMIPRSCNYCRSATPSIPRRAISPLRCCCRKTVILHVRFSRRRPRRSRYASTPVTIRRRPRVEYRSRPGWYHLLSGFMFPFAGMPVAVYRGRPAADALLENCSRYHAKGRDFAKSAIRFNCPACLNAVGDDGGGDAFPPHLG